MNKQLALLLNELTSTFYATQATSFSNTRTRAWSGFNRLLPYIKHCGEPLTILDVAAGNLRFESFLATNFPTLEMEITTLDSCDLLTQSQNFKFTPYQHIRSEHLDIIQSLFEGSNNFLSTTTSKSYKLVCSFGFFHHVPTAQKRIQLLHKLLDVTSSGGYVIVSLWQFMKSEHLAKKAHVSHTKALNDLETNYQVNRNDFEENDFLLGWQHTQKAYRYCHHFSDREINTLIEDVRLHADLVEDFNADGKSEDLNRYLIFQKK